MNSALIFAGGSGKRMNSKTKPKQFLEVNGKAIIIHTIEYFEKNENIDNIVVVCIEEWIEHLDGLLKKNLINKVKWIVPGGKTGQESIYNGLKVLYENCDNPKESIVLIHDGVRPLISKELINDNINCVKEFGNAITVTFQNETSVVVDSNNRIEKINDRKSTKVARAPQSFYLEDIMQAHNKTTKLGENSMIDSASLMKNCGHDLYIVEGPVENIKITTPSDYYIMRAIFEARENSQIFGF